MDMLRCLKRLADAAFKVEEPNMARQLRVRCVMVATKKDRKAAHIHRSFLDQESELESRPSPVLLTRTSLLRHRHSGEISPCCDN